MDARNRPDRPRRNVTNAMQRPARTALIGWLILLLGSAYVPAAPSTPASASVSVEPGMEYIHHRIGDGPWSIHVVKVGRTNGKFRLVSSLARDTIYGLATVREQVGALPAGLGRPVAAVNGDFFVIRRGPYQGDPLGLHVARGELVSVPNGPSFWIDRDGQPHIGQIACKFRATGPGGLDLPFGLNQERAADAAVLYTPTVGPSTRTPAGLELILEKSGAGDWLPLRVGGSYRARIVRLVQEGATALTPDTMVLSIGPSLAAKLPAPAPGTVISLDLKTSPDLTGVVTAVAGGPILLSNGNVVPVGSPPRRHPRTLLGWNTKEFVLAVVDGRQEGLSIGMNYSELTSLMSRLGCEYAMNLDGGGSSTLWLDGHIMNSPSDGRERAVANSLIFVAAEPNETGEAVPGR